MTKKVILTAKLDSAAAETLRDQFLDARDQDILLDGSNVDYLGGLCLDLMMSAKHLWSGAGKSFALENPSASLVDDLGRFGLAQDTFAEDAT